MAEITLKIHIDNIALFTIGEYIVLNQNIGAIIIGLKSDPTGF